MPKEGSQPADFSAFRKRKLDNAGNNPPTPAKGIDESITPQIIPFGTRRDTNTRQSLEEIPENPFNIVIPSVKEIFNEDVITISGVPITKAREDLSQFFSDELLEQANENLERILLDTRLEFLLELPDTEMRTAKLREVLQHTYLVARRENFEELREVTVTFIYKVPKIKKPADFLARLDILSQINPLPQD